MRGSRARPHRLFLLPLALLFILGNASGDDDDGGGDDDNTAMNELKRLLEDLQGIVGSTREKMKMRNGKGKGKGLAGPSDHLQDLQLQTQKKILSMAAKDILTVEDKKGCERRVIDVSHLTHGWPKAKLMNRGLVAAMEYATPRPGMNDIGCPGFMPLLCKPQARFRTITGICNNLNRVLWGSSTTGLTRFLPAAYADGFNEPRGGKERSRNVTLASTPLGKPDIDTECYCSSNPAALLPNPRLVSMNFHLEHQEVDTRTTATFAQFGQFIAHDMSLSPTIEAPGVNCCKRPQHPACLPVFIPKSDWHFRNKGKVCIDLKRSITFCRQNATIRTQANALTSFIDGSVVYGSNYKVSTSMRAFKHGLLKETKPGRLLHKVSGNYTGGDVRARIVPGLTGMHTLFVREHNRIANFYRKALPDADDEEIFQLSRRILGAELQVIMYTGFLPLVLGDETMKKYNLTPRFEDGKHKHKDTYNPDMNPGIRVSFSTAAFRFGHSMVPGTVDLHHLHGGQKADSYRISDNFFDSTMYERGQGRSMEECFYGQQMIPSKHLDPNIDSDLSERLFKKIVKGGSDLATHNIARGRDHGLPGYNDFRELCGLDRACSWFQPPAEIDEGTWHRLSTLYKAPSDLDLFTAGLAEKPHKGGLVGRTFNCLIARQMEAIKFGDRFYFSFTDGAQPFQFSRAQIEELLKVSLTSLFCDNTKMRKARKDPFSIKSGWEHCGKHATLDLDKFVPKRRHEKRE